MNMKTLMCNMKMTHDIVENKKNVEVTSNM